jgi:hypothetical protein
MTTCSDTTDTATSTGKSTSSADVGRGPGLAPGWYSDPERADRLRYWDGTFWTEHTHAPVPPTDPGAPVLPVAGPAGPADEGGSDEGAPSMLVTTFGSTRRAVAAGVALVALSALVVLGIGGMLVLRTTGSGPGSVPASQAMASFTKQGLTCSPGGRTISKSELMTRIQGSPDEAGKQEAVDLMDGLPDGRLTVIGCLREDDFEPSAVIFAHHEGSRLMADIVFADSANADGLDALGIPVVTGPNMAGG